MKTFKTNGFVSKIQKWENPFWATTVEDISTRERKSGQDTHKFNKILIPSYHGDIYIVHCNKYLYSVLGLVIPCLVLLTPHGCSTEGRHMYYIGMFVIPISIGSCLPCAYNHRKLDGVGPVDNIPSTD